jgi:hypothetical protein
MKTKSISLTHCKSAEFVPGQQRQGREGLCLSVAKTKITGEQKQKLTGQQRQGGQRDVLFSLV